MVFDQVEKIISSLGDNPYFGAGFGLVGVGAGVAAGRKALAVGTLLFRRHCMMTLEITHRDRSYSWILNWLTHQHKSSQHLSVVTQFSQRESGHISSEFNFVPSVGTHFMQFRNRWMKIERDRQQTAVDLNLGLPFETIKFTCLGNDRRVFVDMLEYAKELEVSKHEGKTVIYEPRTNDWSPFGEPRQKRHYESVILDTSIAERISNDVNEFLKTREWYTSRGVPYRRGYLLYGPPGCGKTSYIMALAGKLDYDICQMNLSNSALSDERLNYLLNVAPSKSIILLEDIDAAFVNRDLDPELKSAYQGMGRVTLSGLLNVIDGVSSSEERIMFMTTNYLDRLDPALIRPGRVDLKQYIGYASDDQLTRAFKRFYPEGDPELCAKFVDAINKARKHVTQTPVELSMADVQSYLLCFKDRPIEAIDGTSDWIIQKTTDTKRRSTGKTTRRRGSAKPST